MLMVAPTSGRLPLSQKRCQQYCAAATAASAVGPAVTVGALRQRRHPDFALSQKLAAAARATETAPLLSHLRRAALAARLALRVSSAASWLHRMRLLDLSVRTAAEGAVLQGAVTATRVGAASAEVSPASTTVGSSGLPGLVRPIPIPARAVAVATVTTMIGRLRARAGLMPTVTDIAATQRNNSPQRSDTGSGKRHGSADNGDDFRSDGAGGGAGGDGDSPVAVLVEINLLLRDVFEAVDYEKFGEQERLLGSGPGNATQAVLGVAVSSLLERGLAAVAYRYLYVCHLCRVEECAVGVVACSDHYLLTPRMHGVGRCRYLGQDKASDSRFRSALPYQLPS